MKPVSAIRLPVGGCTENPVLTALEHIAVFLHESDLKSLFVTVYRPGSSPPTSTFFDKFADLLDRIVRYSSVIITGDINIHLDNVSDSATVSIHNLSQV